MFCCEIQSCHARRHDLGGHSSFSSTSLVSLLCAWNITTVEINSGIHLLKVKSAKCLCLLPLVLLLVTARPPSWWGLLLPPKNPTPLSAFGLDFRPFIGPWTGGTSPDVSTEQSRRRRTVVCYSCGQPGASAASVRHRDVEQSEFATTTGGVRIQCRCRSILLFITHKIQHKKTYIIQIQLAYK